MSEDSGRDRMIRIGLVASAIALAVMAATSVVGLIRIPADALIPTHWNFGGEADRYAGRTEALVLAPSMALVLAIVFSVIPRIDPRHENLEKSRPLFLTGWIGAMVFLAAIHIFIIASAIGGPPPAILLIGGAGILVAALGTVLHRSRPNFFAGVRTPWTLSSDRAWLVANRWAGRFLVATGLAAALTGFLGAFTASLVVLLGGLVASAVAATVISYRVWKADTDRAGRDRH